MIERPDIKTSNRQIDNSYQVKTGETPSASEADLGHGSDEFGLSDRIMSVEESQAFLNRKDAHARIYQNLKYGSYFSQNNNPMALGDARKIISSARKPLC